MNRRSITNSRTAQQVDRATPAGRAPRSTRPQPLARFASSHCPAGRQELLTSDVGTEVYGAYTFDRREEERCTPQQLRRWCPYERQGISAGEPERALWPVASTTERATNEVESSEA